MINLLFKLLEKHYLVYYEITVLYKDGRTKDTTFISKALADKVYNSEFSTLKDASVVTFDKYISIKGRYLIKDTEFHKGKFINE